MIKMEEFLCSIHNYTKFSSMTSSFYDIAQAALDCGLDAVFTTDKNVYAAGHDQYYYRAEKRMLMICGEELLPLSFVSCATAFESRTNPVTSL